MSLVRRRREPFALEDMSQMSATIAAYNLGTLHTEGPINVSGNRPRDRVKVCGPAAAGIELVCGLVERGIAA